MPKTNIKEIGFEEFIEQFLIADKQQKTHGYRKRLASQYNKELCMDTELVLEFIQATQSDAWEKLSQQYGADEVTTKFLKRLDDEISTRGTLSVLREGIADRGVHFKLAYWMPQSAMNDEAWKEYHANILSVTRQVKYSTQNENSIDLVLFLNGLPIFTIELKNHFTGQTVKNAIEQYKTDRDPKEKLLAYKRCLTHFAVDTEQIFMTTRLKGLATRFLPFNKGDKNSSGNPIVEGKYKTHYFWEDVLSRDSVLELVARFIHAQTEESEDSKGRKKKTEMLLFPRYHQRDAVRRLIADAREHGPGTNYLIQHSAGSGKSNTIAWLAHQLSELHDARDARVFDTIIVITDRRILDRQLSETVESFASVRGVVAHAESSAELRDALEKGVTIITSTLQKFPVIVDAIEATKGKKFAVIIDEAHSSQSGDSASDLRAVLTLDEAEKQEEKAFKTSEDVIIERMRARKIKTQNISFFAFTATPKQKTLELFGMEDPLSGKFYPFSLYSMKQAIEEGFILDVLKNYTTYQTYFGLLKKVQDDPEYSKKKAQRLLIGYVERHEHAIDMKTKIIVEHFEEKIARDIYGRAKAMIVTKSRLHAVKYKLAFDRYLREKGYGHKALVAFSGSVRDGKLEFSEPQMNGGIPEKQTAHEFKKDTYTFLIVAEKFQTGFDQPLLEAMYVDKKLSGVNAVQTLSRLNRTTAGKTDVFVLDFVNTTDDIKDAFQPYYTTTVLSEATDPNILHDLYRDVMQFKLFADHEMNGFVDDYLNGAKPDVLNAAVDAIVERYKKLLDEEQDDFKTKSRDYVRKYAFISQIIAFSDPALEKLYYFLKFLIRKLPALKSPLPYEILEAVDMDSYKVDKIADARITLENEEGIVEPIGSGSRFEVYEEMDPLSKIIKDINERFGTAFTSEDKVILNNLSQKLVENEALKGTIRNNSKDAAKIKFNELFQDALLAMVTNHFDLYRRLDSSSELKEYVNDRIFDFVSKKVNVDYM